MEFDFSLIRYQNPKLIFRIDDILESNVSERYTLTTKAYQGVMRRSVQRTRCYVHKIGQNDNATIGTITTRYHGWREPKFFIHQEGDNPRFLTELECLKLMGFKDRVKLPSAKDSPEQRELYKCVGNSVSVPVIKAIAESIHYQYIKHQEWEREQCD